MASETPAPSPYERALRLCPDDAAKLELSRLGMELGLGTSSPEWIVVVLYAEARRLLAPTANAREPAVRVIQSRELLAYILGIVTAIALAYAAPAIGRTPQSFSDWFFGLAVALGAIGALAYIRVSELLNKPR